MKAKSTKLSNQLRDSILSQIITKAFDDRAKKIMEERMDFSLTVYNDLYNESTRKEMYDLPDGWLPESDEFYVQFGSAGSGYCRRAFKDSMRFLWKHKKSYSQCLKVYEESDPLSVQHDELTKKVEKLDEERAKAKRDAYAIIYSCNTTKQLKDVWPAIAKYVEQYEPAIERTTDIVPITDGLNAILGLD